MITGFGYKDGTTVWIDPEEDPFTIFSTSSKIKRRIPDEWGKIEDLFTDKEGLKVKTDKGIYLLNE